jgi:hypothetical protein
MLRYNVILVDGKLAINWQDETRPEAIDRARQERQDRNVRTGAPFALQGARPKACLS